MSFTYTDIVGGVRFQTIGAVLTFNGGPAISLPESAMFLRGATDGSRSLVTFKGHETGHAWVVTDQAQSLDLGPTYGNQCVAAGCIGPGRFVIVVLADGQTWKRWIVSADLTSVTQIDGGTTPPAITPPSEGMLDLDATFAPIWIAQRRAVTVGGHALYLPMTRGAFTVGQATAGPAGIVAWDGSTLFRVFTGDDQTPPRVDESGTVAISADTTQPFVTRDQWTLEPDVTVPTLAPLPAPIACGLCDSSSEQYGYVDPIGNVEILVRPVDLSKRRDPSRPFIATRDIVNATRGTKWAALVYGIWCDLSEGGAVIDEASLALDRQAAADFGVPVYVYIDVALTPDLLAHVRKGVDVCVVQAYPLNAETALQAGQRVTAGVVTAHAAGLRLGLMLAVYTQSGFRPVQTVLDCHPIWRALCDAFPIEMIQMFAALPKATASGLGRGGTEDEPALKQIAQQWASIAGPLPVHLIVVTPPVVVTPPTKPPVPVPAPVQAPVPVPVEDDTMKSTVIRFQGIGIDPADNRLKLGQAETPLTVRLIDGKWDVGARVEFERADNGSPIAGLVSFPPYARPGIENMVLATPSGVARLVIARTDGRTGWEFHDTDANGPNFLTAQRAPSAKGLTFEAKGSEGATLPLESEQRFTVINHATNAEITAPF